MSNKDPLIGKKLGDYVIQDMLGQGGMARVYRGYDETLDRFAAVKVIEPQLVSGEDDEEYQDRFVREARAIARLNHPSVVGIFQFGDIDKELYYMAMVFVEGSDLRHILKEYIKKDRFLSYAQVLKIITDICEALDYSHKQGVIHRDVKPSNIMVMADGHAVLTDFGLALNTSEGTIGNTFGSVHYIAPEQAVSSAQAVPQSDLYSLGVVLYEMLVGRVPFEDMSAMSVALKHISDPPPEPSLLNPKISSQIEEVVMKTLDKDPRRRYPSGKALIHALQGAFAASPDEDTEELDDASPLPEGVTPVIERPKTQPQPLVLPDKPSTLTDRNPQDDKPTISDTSPRERIASDTAKRQQSTSTSQSEEKGEKSRTGLFIIGAVILAIVVVGLLLFSGGLGGGDDDGDDNNASALTAQAIAALTTEEATDTPTLEIEETATEVDEGIDTEEPIAIDTEVISSATDIEELVTETLTRTATDTITLATNTAMPSATPDVTETPIPVASPPLSLTATDDEAALLLRYDGRTLALYNRAPANTEIDISDLTFVRQRANGSLIIFEASEWAEESGNDRVDGMRSRLDCFQVLSMSFTDTPTNEYPLEICRFVQGFMQTPRTFWITSTAGATFDVMRDDVVLATCPAVPSSFRGEVYCEVELREDEDD